jgi:Protein of unknown function (DUF1353)
MKIKLSPTNSGLLELDDEASVTFDGVTVIIQKGYIYDGESIPKLFWAAIGSPFDPMFMRASLFHAYCYKHEIVSKSFADSLFKFLLLDDGVDAVTADELYDAVYVFGWRYYGQKYIMIKSL